eukprot:6219444-Pyramimonas_sp.AAC.1
MRAQIEQLYAALAELEALEVATCPPGSLKALLKKVLKKVPSLRSSKDKERGSRRSSDGTSNGAKWQASCG